MQGDDKLFLSQSGVTERRPEGARRDPLFCAVVSVSIRVHPCSSAVLFCMVTAWRRQAGGTGEPRLRPAAVRRFLPGPCPSSLWNDSGCIEIVNGNCEKDFPKGPAGKGCRGDENKTSLH